MAPKRPCHVLVVDDNAVIRTVLANMLEHLGATCDAAASGADAIQAARGAKYDLVIMDLRMPDVDGPTSARGIREATGPSCPRIVGLTGSASGADVDGCRLAGMAAVLHKPLRLADLESLLGDLSETLARGAG